jgi:hypothetical protein
MHPEPTIQAAPVSEPPSVDLSQYARLLGRRGGAVKSERKTLAARKNGALGGRPKKEPKPANE